ncbi:LAFA_0D11276g1_1 [Lachancea sp. 'fantastica']|nr:LAFA_0D11276g1_1 [Lachancea sp. 'fantastica']
MFNSGRSSSAAAGSGIGGSSLFGQSKPAGGGLFGQQNQQGQSGGLFGQGAPQKPATSLSGTSGGLFGQNTQNTGATGQNTGGTGLFGQSGQNNTGGGLFGQQGNAPAASNTTNTGGGLFGQNTANSSGGLFGQNNQNTNANSSSGGLFGQNTNASTGTSGGLFGAKPTGFGNSSAAPSGGLFGNNAANTTSGSTSGGLFGNSTVGQNTSGGLFGNSNNAPQASSGGLFGSKPAGTSLFNNTNSNNALQPPMQAQPALQTLSQLPINPMTRVADLPPQIRQEIEQLDQYVQRQVAISQHLKADFDDHIELIRSIPRDIKYLQTTHSVTHQSLMQDLRKITGIKDTIDQNMTDSQTFSTIFQQLITPGSKISSIELDKFFQDKIQQYKHKLDEYFNVLSDIESAVQGIERDMFGATSTDGGADSGADGTNWKTGINAIVSTVLEEFELFMDMAERVAELHQKVKEFYGAPKASVVKV